MIGFVSLVGAGPGDPELLTLKATRRLAEADVVLYDALVCRDALKLAPRARWFYVGKRAGRGAIEQRTIERLMVRLARRGQRVVRLKCGDPFVFGRGGEEGIALAEAGIPFEVIPGVTSAIAAPALAGIPVTHRGISTGFFTVSGHAESAYRPVLESMTPGAATVVVLMGLGRREAIASLLLDRGWDPGTPAAIILGASHSNAATWTGVLADLGTADLDLSSGAPGILVVGQVVSLADSLVSPSTGSTEESTDSVAQAGG